MIRWLFEAAAVAFLAGAAWLAYLIGPRFAGIPYEYEVLFGGMFAALVATAVICHREALLYEGVLLLGCTQKPTPDTWLCHSLDWMPWPRPTPTSSDSSPR